MPSARTRGRVVRRAAGSGPAPRPASRARTARTIGRIELRFRIGMMPGMIGMSTPTRAHALDQPEVVGGAEEHLGDRELRARVVLGLQHRARRASSDSARRGGPRGTPRRRREKSPRGLDQRDQLGGVGQAARGRRPRRARARRAGRRAAPARCGRRPRRSASTIAVELVAGVPDAGQVGHRRIEVSRAIRPVIRDGAVAGASRRRRTSPRRRSAGSGSSSRIDRHSCSSPASSLGGKNSNENERSPPREQLADGRVVGHARESRERRRVTGRPRADGRSRRRRHAT